MPRHPRDLMDTKREFLELALQVGANRHELCRRFGISPKTGYALLRRHVLQGTSDVCKPRSPTAPQSFAQQRCDRASSIELRRQHPRRGGRKIAQRPSDLGFSGVPAPSTITGILHSHGLITPKPARRPNIGSVSSTNCPMPCGKSISRATSRRVRGAAIR